MNTADKLRLYHRVIRWARWRDDLYDLDKRFWHGMRKPKKADLIFQAHLDRCMGRASPAACDLVLEAAMKR